MCYNKQWEMEKSKEKKISFGEHLELRQKYTVEKQKDWKYHLCIMNDKSTFIMSISFNHINKTSSTKCASVLIQP